MSEYQGAWIAGFYGKSLFSFVRNHQAVFSKVAVLLCTLTTSEHSAAPYPHQHLVVVVFWILAYSKGVQRGVVYHCFNLHSLDYILCGASFLLRLFAICLSSFGEVSVKMCPFVKLGCLFSYVWSLRIHCIFWITVLYWMCLFVNIFFQVYSLFLFSWYCLRQSISLITKLLAYQSFLSIGPVCGHHNAQDHELFSFCVLHLGHDLFWVNFCEAWRKD